MTYDQVAKMADDLRNKHPDQKNPSVRQVFAVIGGDYNAVQKHMRAWRLMQVSASPDSAPSLSASILRALSEEVTQQRKLAIATQSAELDDCREELDDLQREYGVRSNEIEHLKEQLRSAITEREHATAERDHVAELVERLQEQVAAERATAESSRIELAQTRLKASADVELVSALKGDLDLRRSEFEIERAARIESERKLAATESARLGAEARIEDYSARLAGIAAELDAMRKAFEAERSKREEAERGRDIADARVVAAVAKADDLQLRETDLRRRLDQLALPPGATKQEKRSASAVKNGST